MAREDRHRHRERSSAKREKKKRRHRHDHSSDDEEAREARAERRARRKSEKMLASFGYSNETNPFGDSNLSQPFVWGKKYEDKASGGPPSEKELKRKQLARVEEIRKARKRREEREAEQEEMERLKSEELRLRDAEQYEDWQQKEEAFHLRQAKVRSQLRIRASREKPVDLLAKNLLLVSARAARDDGGDGDKTKAQQKAAQADDDFFRREVGRIRVEHRRPHAIVEVLSLDELLELQEDVRTYLELEESGNGGENAEFWRLMRLVTDDRVRRLRRAQSEGRAGRGAIHDAVNENIAEMLDDKDSASLRELREEVRATVSSGAAGVDVEFWEEVAQQLEVRLARNRLTELHEAMLSTLADLMEEHERREAEEKAARAEESGDVGADGRDASREAKDLERSYAKKGLEETEEKLGASEEVTLAEESAPKWSEKYQPRKPRYFNRVKTGYDWNKYNQTHYDHDNPPPKVVQGYKFNLFYPDLLDKQTAPRFFLEKTSSSAEFCVIRFSAGPPYQDIAFKIVNREWEYSRKRGFKSVFERGILHLYFNFKRHRYRR